MAQNGCVGNYANQLAERSSNLDWQINTAKSLVADRYEGINNVPRSLAIQAYKFLLSVGTEIAISEDQL